MLVKKEQDIDCFLNEEHYILITSVFSFLKKQKNRGFCRSFKFLLTPFVYICYTNPCVKRRLIMFTAPFRKMRCRVSVIER